MLNSLGKRPIPYIFVPAVLDQLFIWRIVSYTRRSFGRIHSTFELVFADIYRCRNVINVRGEIVDHGADAISATRGVVEVFLRSPAERDSAVGGEADVRRPISMGPQLLS